MKKRILLIIGLASIMMLLAGCTEIKEPITADSEGFWNSYIVYPLSALIIWLSEAFGENYGLGIIGVTLIIRLALLPLMIKQVKSSKAMQAIQPEMKELQAKYSSKDAATQQKLQQETMALFSKYNVNPLAGCLPILVQMPILIGFYHAISRTEEIALHSFLWFDLGSPDPYYILPVVAGITTFIQQKMSMAGMNSNPQMAAQMTMMLYIMPIMIVVFAINFPAALSLYWVVGNIFGIVQTYFIKGPDLRKAAAENAGGAKKK
ncbi:YidC family membrane integrase SpoIIIJ [Peribacillus sp. NPDC101481]|uniref:YidC family membrane integrase SpoIIIJ n=1 Tax=Peribacillus TaxID=2675229 RepID=UPI000BED7CB3|nr:MULTISPECIES: YidC family membrane integrase SpoIIIJ [Peribacillus]MBD8138372.1 YidC family membrane integrase SpoIIIJ [Bacillus sp. CFBP 13597]PEF37406.1 OxaA precursor [Bacillus sp. AFS094228]PEO49991.1 OxaA precursor [Bacillus sp. AFS026049]QNK49676.1 YidC family membrane integrase SpoIIIJ [Brevibacterium sp. PAMC23299]MCR8870399.1 YidC family membrane integrase SpoIIIJ [Peribacillus frigoritolerans]